MIIIIIKSGIDVMRSYWGEEIVRSYAAKPFTWPHSSSVDVMNL